MIKKIVKKLQRNYVMKHVENTTIPHFEASKRKRQHFIFTGKVQGVGFRVEIYGIARRLGLTGWVRNNEDGSVEAEMQGERAKIEYLVQFMKDLKRAEVQHVTITDLVLNENESEFDLRM